MSGVFLYLAKPTPNSVPAVSIEEVVRTMLDARLDAPTPPQLVAQAAHILCRSLRFDACGSYWVALDRPTSLTLTAAEGFPPEFTEVARSLSLSDYDQVADLPYNDDHGSCYGDFFASVVGTFGIRSWLVASLIEPETRAIIGAILLGARDGRRFDSNETQLVQSLVAQISERFSPIYHRECADGSAAFDKAA